MKSESNPTVPAGVTPPRSREHPGERTPRILFVTDRMPGNDSGYSMRVTNVIRGLTTIGELHVCLIDSSVAGVTFPPTSAYTSTTIRASNPSKLKKLFLALTSLAQVPYRRGRALRTAIAEELAGGEWDLVWFSRIRTYAICRSVLRGSRVVVDFDDLNDRLVRSLIADRTARRGRLVALPRNVIGRMELRRWSRLQEQVAQEVDLVTVCSEADHRYLGYDNCAIVRNGYPVPRSTTRSPDTENPTVLMVGPLSYEPNCLAAEWLAFEVMPRVREEVPEARAIVVGSDEGATQRLREADGVTLTGYVTDLEPYYAAARIAVAPLRSGGGTRLKVIEALARSVPMVSTSVGTFGLDLVDGKDLLVADDEDQFARACISLITDPDLSSRLTEQGLATYRERLTSDACSDAVRSIASRLVSLPR